MAAKGRRPIVYLTSGIFGYLFRFFPIGRRLRATGHDVVVVTASGRAADHARAEGFEVLHLAAEHAALDALVPCPWPARIAPLTRRVPGLSLGPRDAARAHWERRAQVMADTAELVNALAHLEPGLVLTEAEEHRGIRVAAGLGMPLLLFEDLYSTRPGPDVPFPARSHHVPTGSRWSRVRAAASWQRFFAVEAVRRRAERWWVDGNDWHSSLARVAADAGFDQGTMSRNYLQFYDYPQIPRVRTIAPELAFPGEPSRPHVTGPVVDVERVVHDIDPGFAEHWSRVQERRAEGARIVYVSLGTFLTGLVDLTREVIEAAAGLPDTELVVSVGLDADRWAGVSTPDNVGVFGRVPQLEVLPAADVAVATGGLNTGHEALWFGVPVLNLPVAGIDTPGNAARFTYHRVGRRLTASEVSVDSLRTEIGILLDDPGYRARAAAMGARLRARDGIAAATAVIEDAFTATG